MAKQPISERRRQAALANLAKAWQARPHKPKPTLPDVPRELRQVRPGSPAALEQARMLAALLQADGVLPPAMADWPMLHVAAANYLLVKRLWEYLERAGLVRDDGDMRQSCIELLLRAIREARESFGALGATPQARSRLGLEVAAAEDAALRLARLRADRAIPVDAHAVEQESTGEEAGAPADSPPPESPGRSVAESPPAGTDGVQEAAPPAAEGGEVA